MHPHPPWLTPMSIAIRIRKETTALSQQFAAQHLLFVSVQHRPHSAQFVRRLRLAAHVTPRDQRCYDVAIVTPAPAAWRHRCDVRAGVPGQPYALSGQVDDVGPDTLTSCNLWQRDIRWMTTAVQCRVGTKYDTVSRLAQLLTKSK